jgi:hypothetical protein
LKIDHDDEEEDEYERTSTNDDEHELPGSNLETCKW